MHRPRKDPWRRLARWTPARVALGRTGASLPTREVLAFASAHACARDAVHASFDADGISRRLAALQLETLAAETDAVDRAVFLRRPDYGRRLSRASRERLAGRTWAGADLALVIGDGLSAAAVCAHAVPLVAAFLPHAASLQLSLAPVVIARGARVALGDEIGSLMRVRVVAMLIGERPGLSAPDSLGIYLTYGPRPGRTDAERNCISNVRPSGLGYDIAAFKLAWLVREALKRSLSGVALKDESDALVRAGETTSVLVQPRGGKD
ncbi:MAG: ethanolamine ammonia-lyase subunit EutC [Hyphomicrobiaceae bacterium]|nr:MAG: ethanolamine ammonia-lyase subunit EutC [Hyphomicrobiaceae bacterium]